MSHHRVSQPRELGVKTLASIQQFRDGKETHCLAEEDFSWGHDKESHGEDGMLDLVRTCLSSCSEVKYQERVSESNGVVDVSSARGDVHVQRKRKKAPSRGRLLGNAFLVRDNQHQLGGFDLDGQSSPECFSSKSGNAHHVDYSLALARALATGQQPDSSMYSNLVQECASQNERHMAELYLAKMIHTGMKPDTGAVIELFTAYVQQGEAACARQWLFEFLKREGLAPAPPVYDFFVRPACTRDSDKTSIGDSRITCLVEQKNDVDDLRRLILFYCAHPGRGSLAEAEQWLQVLLAQGSQPSVAEFQAITEASLRVGNLEKAKLWWDRAVAQSLFPQFRDVVSAKRDPMQMNWREVLLAEHTKFLKRPPTTDEFDIKFVEAQAEEPGFIAICWLEASSVFRSDVSPTKHIAETAVVRKAIKELYPLAYDNVLKEQSQIDDNDAKHAIAVGMVLQMMDAGLWIHSATLEVLLKQFASCEDWSAAEQLVVGMMCHDAISDKFRNLDPASTIAKVLDEILCRACDEGEEDTAESRLYSFAQQRRLPTQCIDCILEACVRIENHTIVEKWLALVVSLGVEVSAKTLRAVCSLLDFVNLGYKRSFWQEMLAVRLSRRSAVPVRQHTTEKDLVRNWQLKHSPKTLREPHAKLSARALQALSEVSSMEGLPHKEVTQPQKMDWICPACGNLNSWANMVCIKKCQASVALPDNPDTESKQLLLQDVETWRAWEKPMEVPPARPPGVFFVKSSLKALSPSEAELCEFGFSSISTQSSLGASMTSTSSNSLDRACPQQNSQHGMINDIDDVSASEGDGDALLSRQSITTGELGKRLRSSIEVNDENCQSLPIASSASTDKSEWWQPLVEAVLASAPCIPSAESMERQLANCERGRDKNRAISKAAKENDVSSTLQQVFDLLHDGGTPDAIACNAILELVARHQRRVAVEQWLHAMEKLGVERCLNSYNSIIVGLCLRDSPEEAEIWIQKMMDYGINPTITTYVNIIRSYARVGRAAEARRCWNRSLEVRNVDLTTKLYNKIIDAFSKEGNLDEAEKWFNQMPELQLEPDQYSINSLLYACGRQRSWEKASSLMAGMAKLNIRPNKISFNNVIEACTNAKQADEAVHWLEQMLAYGFPPNAFVFGRITHAFAKSGRLEDAEQYLAKMRSNHFRPSEALLECMDKLRKKAARERGGAPC